MRGRDRRHGGAAMAPAQAARHRRARDHGLRDAGATSGRGARQYGTARHIHRSAGAVAALRRVRAARGRARSRDPEACRRAAQPREPEAARRHSVWQVRAARRDQDQDRRLVDRRARARGACRTGPCLAAENPRLAAGLEAALDLYRRAAGLRQSDDESRAHELRARRAPDGPPLLLRAEPAEHPGPHRGGPPHSPCLCGDTRHQARFRRLFADRAAAAGRDRQHRAAEESVPRRPRHPRHDGLGNVRRAGQGHAGRSAPSRQGDQLRDHLWHLGVRACGAARHRARGGRRLHQEIFRALPRHPRLHGRDQDVCQNQRLRAHFVRAQVPLSRHPRLQRHDPLVQRARLDQRAAARHRRRHHPPRHDPDGRGARQEEAQRPDAPAGARRAGVRSAGGRGRQDAAGDHQGDGGGANAGALAVSAVAGRSESRPQLGRGALMRKVELRRLGNVALLALPLGLTPSGAHAAGLDGAQLSWPWALPFIGILLTIATGPLLFPRIWHRHYGKLAFAWATLTLAPMAALYGTPTAVAVLVHALLGEYLSFIVLLLTLYVVAGGILVTGYLRGTPLVNTVILVFGTANLLLIAAIIAAILGAALWKPGIAFDIYGTKVELQDLLRDIVLLAIAFLSLVLTHDEHREANGFTWDPIVEVAILFAGIFACIIPVLAMLQVGKDGSFAWLLAAVTAGDGSPHEVAYFWLTGILSAFLDNAPTSLVFFELAGGDAAKLMGPLAGTLAAISMGAVYMGAMTYIGNAPNLMVYAIALERGIKMPSFFGYLVWSSAVLLPVLAIATVVFIW